MEEAKKDYNAVRRQKYREVYESKKEAQNAKRREAYQLNVEERRAKRREYNERNRENVRECSRRFYQQHKEELNQKIRNKPAAERKRARRVNEEVKEKMQCPVCDKARRKIYLLDHMKLKHKMDHFEAIKKFPSIQPHIYPKSYRTILVNVDEQSDQPISVDPEQ